MFQKLINNLKSASCFLIFIFSVLTMPSSLSAGQIDKTRYITIDEISPGMDAYCLTVYKGIEIEKFNLKVVDVIRNMSPGRNAILVMGTDERFIHTGPVAGCSGSPVYINNRLAGALAFGWTYSKDPLYGVTPIDEMLSVGDDSFDNSNLSSAPIFDFSKPINFKTAYNQTINFRNNTSKAAGVTMLPCPIATTLPAESFSNCSGTFESFGLFPVSAGDSAGLSEYADMQMKPGSILALPFVYGDIELAAIGTVTEVAGDNVYAFGHEFLGQGPIDVPMATGYVHTVVANVVRSFKFGQTVDIKGSLYSDQSAAVVGKIGRKAVTIPMRIKIDRFNDKQRTYNCSVVSHRLLTSLMANVALSGTALFLGPLPSDHSVQYKTRIGIEGYEPVSFENFSSLSELDESLADSIGALSLILNNPYDRPRISSLDFEVKILPKTEVSHIWSLNVSDTKVQPGQTITVSATLEGYLAGHKNYETALTIPDNISPGSYNVLIVGASDYLDFSLKSAPYKYIPENLPSLIKIINNVANIKRTDLYVILTLPPDGIAIESAQLPELPLTKTILLNNEKRAMISKPVARWIEKIIPVDTVVLDSKSLDIVVEDNQKGKNKNY